MSTFDLAAAQRGEPVQFCQTNGEWIDVHFVGISRSGVPLVQLPNASTLITSALRIKPAPRYCLEFENEDERDQAQAILSDHNVSSVCFERPAAGA